MKGSKIAPRGQILPPNKEVLQKISRNRPTYLGGKI